MAAPMQSPEINQSTNPATKRARGINSLRVRLILALAAAAIIPVEIASFLGSNLTQARSERASLDLLENTALKASTLTDNFLNEARTFPRVLAKSGLFVDALRTSIADVDAQGLASLPPSVVDERFTATKVLRDFPDLNEFLAATAAAGSVSEVILTESHGINIALSQATSDVVQSDEDWWQKTRVSGKPQTLNLYDESTDTIAIELTDVIRDPITDELLGVLKVGTPVSILEGELSRLFGGHEGQDAEGHGGHAHGDDDAFHGEMHAADGGQQRAVESIQLLDAYTIKSKPLVTIDDGGVSSDGEQTVIGGDRVKAAAVYLRRVQSISAVTPQEASEALASEYGLQPQFIERAEVGGNSTLIAIFGDEDRVYSLVAVRGAPWVTLASTRKATIAAASNELSNVFLYTGLSLAGITVILAFLLAEQLTKPLRALTSAAQKVAAGNLDTQAEAIGTEETKTLAGSFNNLVERVKTLLQTQQKEAERDRLFASVALVGKSEELEVPLNALMASFREDLAADRVVVYRFKPDGSGYIAAEDVLFGLPKALGSTVFDACIPKELLDGYRQGRVVPTENVLAAGFHPEHQQLMERLEIKANLVVPIVAAGSLYGLLVAHHCQQTHAWQRDEIDYLKQGAERLGTTLAGLVLNEQQAAVAEEQALQRRELEESVISLMSDIEAAADGDLTVRAKLMAGDIGIIADLFNAVVENLRETAQEVKRASGQVSNSLGTNEGAIRELADKAIAEAAEVRNTLGSIETMNQSILNVADTAGQAAAIANDAFTTAREGNSAMEQTVQGVLGLRNTIGETSKKMKRLGESAQKISQVVSLIDEIALKTNLLAINASVEANRAGEMGQGFTAVAQQVGSLAEQSAAAAKEIARAIAEIQLETQEAIAAMEQGTAEVVDNTRLVETTKQRLADMLEKSQEIDNLMRSISDATTSQAETSQVVSTLMQQITEASEARSHSSREVAEAIQSTATVAQSLQSSVEQFKVESV